MTTTTTTKTSVFTYRVALSILRNLKQARREYDEECRRWWARGYRPHYCFHGMNLWVDWDPICGYCEMDYTVYDQALAMAHEQVDEFDRRLAVSVAARQAGMPMSPDGEIARWVMEAVTYTKSPRNRLGAAA